MLMSHDTGKRLGHFTDRPWMQGFQGCISLLARTHPFLTQTTTLLCSTMLQVVANDVLNLPHRIIHGLHLLINLLVHPIQHP